MSSRYYRDDYYSDDEDDYSNSKVDYDDYYSDEDDVIFQSEDYLELNFNQLICQFELDGELNQESNPKYRSELFYRIIFHYCVVKTHDVKTIFRDNSIEYSYNTIRLDGDSNLDNITAMLFKIMMVETKTTCIFFDFKSKTDDRMWHTTLLIYRPDMNRLEHYDPNGVYKYGYTESFQTLIENLKSLNTCLIFVSSKELHGFEEFDDSFAMSRSLNHICSIYDINTEGWCQIWSLFVYDIVNRYPDIPTKSLLNELFSYLKGPVEKKNKYGKSAMIALHIIHGFYIYLISRINSLHPEINLSYSILNSYDPLYTYSDRKLNNLIEEEMEQRVNLIFN